MKRLFLILAFACVATAASAQRDPGVFLGAGGGMNFGFDGYKYEDRPTSHNGAGWAGDFYIGGWAGSWLGVRAGYQGFGISDRYTDFGNRKYSYWHGDVLLRPHRNIIPYLHGGYVNIINPSFGGGAGVAFPIHLGRVVSIVPDIKSTFYSSRAFDAAPGNIATTISATVGLAFTFGGRRHRQATVVDDVTDQTIPSTELVPADAIGKTQAAVPVPTVVVHDTVYVKEVVREVVTETIRDTVYIKQAAGLPETIEAQALFDIDSYVLRREAVPVLDKVAEWFKAHPESRGRIEGHTDDTASVEHNQTLSENRALAVYNYLIEKGVPADQLTHQGFGLVRPVAPNSTVEGRQKNRRVEIKVE